MFLREVVTGQRTATPARYAQIVESFRDEQGRVRKRVLLSLGRVDQLDRQQIQRLVTALSRYLETGEVPPGGRVGQVRDYGIGYVADALWRRLDLPKFFSKQLRSRKYEAPVERAIFAMVAHRMVDPSSKRACSDWLEHDAWLPQSRSITLQHLYRAMDFLDECHEPLEAALYMHRRSLFDKVQLVYYDTTSTYFECDEPGDEPEMYGLRQKGYSRDLRPDRRQIVIGLAVDQNGLPIVSDVHSGETSDSITVVPMLARLRDLGLSRVVWVADRGMASELNLSSVRAARLHYVVGIRLRAAEDLRAAIAADDTAYRNAAEGLLVKDVRLGDRRMVVCFSPESAARDLKLRTGAIDRMRPVLEHVNAGADPEAITAHGLYRRFVARGSDGKFHLDKHKLEREAQCDGHLRARGLRRQDDRRGRGARLQGVTARRAILPHPQAWRRRPSRVSPARQAHPRARFALHVGLPARARRGDRHRRPLHPDQELADANTRRRAHLRPADRLGDVHRPKRTSSALQQVEARRAPENPRRTNPLKSRSVW